MRPSLRPVWPVLLISAAVTGLLCAGAVSVAPDAARTALAWGLGVAAALLTAAATTTAYALESTRRLRRHNTALLSQAQYATAETARATAETARATEAASLATAEARAHAAQAVAEARAEGARATADAKAAAAVAIDEARAETAGAAAQAARAESLRAAAVAACANAAGRMQALATSMLADLRDMEHRHSDEDVLTDLLHLDHRTAQAGRLADSLAVLTGARSGRRWAKPIVMESILRGAMGRISGYQRVRLHSTSEVAIAGHAAEGVMHALAELLDNAANFSPPTAEVHVYVEEVPAGVVITIEDSGLVMSEVQLRRAERAVGAGQSDLSGLSGTRLGLAVVGRLAHKHGLTVSFRPSARGGTGALVMLPQELISRTPRALTAPGATRTPSAAPESGTHERATEAPAPAETAELGESGLPKRRRGRTLAAAHPAEDPDTGSRTGAVRTSGAAPVDARDAKARAARFSSFRQAVRNIPTEGTSPR